MGHAFDFSDEFLCLFSPGLSLASSVRNHLNLGLLLSSDHTLPSSERKEKL